MFSWLVDTAHAMGGPAQQASGAQQNPIMSLIPFILIMVVFYFLFFRPQQKKAKQHQEMIGGLKKGDEVVTSGGIIGKVTAVSDDALTIETTPDVKIRIQRVAVAGVKKSAE